MLRALGCDVVTALALSSVPPAAQSVSRATVAVIAARLFLSDSTVRNYLSSAIGKTHPRNRIEAAESARHHGWL